jgi:hypothetical protein
MTKIQMKYNGLNLDSFSILSTKTPNPLIKVYLK